METVKFANGETHECSYFGSMQDGDTRKAYVAISDVDFLQAANIFSNPLMTAEMEYENRRFVGYTTLTMLGVQPYGIQAVLKGGHDERIE